MLAETERLLSLSRACQARAKKDTNTAAPAFLEFLIAVLKGGQAMTRSAQDADYRIVSRCSCAQEQRVGAVSPPSPLGTAAVGASF